MYVMALIAIHRLFGVFFGHLLDCVFNQVNPVFEIIVFISTYFEVSMLFMILGAWVLSFGAMYFPLTETWGQFGYEPQTFSCTIVESKGETFMPLMSTVGIGLPLALIIACYLAIHWKVKSTGILIVQHLYQLTDNC